MTYMFAESEELIAREWEKYKGYTVRPLPSTCLYYEKWILNPGQSRFLIFGGTPEIRSIFQKNNLPVTLLDQSEKMLRAMGRLTKNRKPISSGENLIISNWLEIRNSLQKFDFIIADDAINMVEWSQFSIFLKNVFQLLNPDGIFVCHLLVKPSDELINQKFHTIYDDFFSGIIKSEYDLASRLNFICYDYLTYGMGWQRTISLLGKANLALFKPRFDFIDTFGLCNSQFYCPPQPQFEELAQSNFNIQEIYYPHEHDYCMFEPIYVLKKRG